MVCPACARPATGICRRCVATMLPAGDRTVGDVVATAAFQHRGAAASLVRNLKYRRSSGSAEILARSMAPLLRRDTRGLVPIPRALSRRVAHGVDPAHELAVRVRRATGTELVPLLRAPITWSRHAGRNRSGRRSIAFRAATPPDGHLVLIDDVVTTGATVMSAVTALRDAHRHSGSDGRDLTISVLAATSAGTMSTGDQVSPEEVA